MIDSQTTFPARKGLRRRDSVGASIREMVDPVDKTLEWHAGIASIPKQWRAESTEQIPDKRVAWTSIDGARNAGVVTFHRLDEGDDRDIGSRPLC